MNLSRTFLRHAFILLFGLSALAVSGQSFRLAYSPDGSFCRDLVETSNGGFLLVGGIETDSSLFLLRTGPNGGQVWTRHQQLNGASAVAVCPASDGGFAVLCENYRDGADLRNLLLKIDSAGNTEWQKILDNPNLPNGYKDIVAVAGGGYALAGDARTFVPVSDFHIRLLRLDDSGNMLWTQTVGADNGKKEFAYRLAEMPNGDLVVGGERRNNAPADASNFFLARLNAQGAVLWEQEYDKTGYQNLADFKVDQAGNLLLFGETRQTDPTRLALLKTDGSGTELWYRQPRQTYSSTAPGAWHFPSVLPSIRREALISRFSIPHFI